MKFTEFDTPLSEPLIFDSHSHYDDKTFDGVRESLLSSLTDRGVNRIITCGCDLESSKKALSLAEKYDFIYAAAGIHPENLESGTTVKQIEDLCRGNKKIVAVGEIGLDYYYNSKNRDEQKKVFEEQLILSNKLGLPVIVHDRDAHSDTLELLKKHRPKGVVHCFSGSPEMAAEILKLGMYIGVGGVITFKNAKRLPDVVKMLPDDRILVETDCPYLAPEPFRGSVCRSDMIYYTAARIAEIRNTSTTEILKQTNKNATVLFGI